MSKTFLGQTVSVRDEVVYIKNLRTGSSTVRKCKCIGVVMEIKKDTVSILCNNKESCYWTEDDFHKVNSNDIICILGKTPYWEWRAGDGN